MSNDNKNIIYTARDIEQYLAGNLSAMEMHAMEKAALNDPFLAEAMEGYESMKGTEWNNELVALRTQIAEKGSVAKVIPLHKTKNNWWKAAAAVFILGGGAALTFVLSKNEKKEKDNPQIAQIITVSKDTTTQRNVEVPAPVTVSLNPTATKSKEDLAITNQPVAKTKNTDEAAGNTVTEPGKAFLKPSGKDEIVALSNDYKKTAVTSSLNTKATEAINNKQQAEESIVAASKSKSAARANAEIDAADRQNNQSGVNAKKEAAFNNFFTAQVVGQDNSPLPFTNISIKKDNFGTYADANGMVRLVSTDSILNIEVRSVGYLPKTFTLRNNQSQTKIFLQEDDIALKDKTIVGSTSTGKKQTSRRVTLLTDSAVNVEPADGWDNYNTYVANNIDMPDEMLKTDFHGEVELSFDVKSNGTISNIRVNKSLGTEYDEAAKRLILEGPQWKVKKGRKTSANVKLKF